MNILNLVLCSKWFVLIANLQRLKFLMLFVCLFLRRRTTGRGILITKKEHNQQSVLPRSTDLNAPSQCHTAYSVEVTTGLWTVTRGNENWNRMTHYLLFLKLIAIIAGKSMGAKPAEDVLKEETSDPTFLPYHLLGWRKEHGLSGF